MRYQDHDGAGQCLEKPASGAGGCALWVARGAFRAAPGLLLHASCDLLTDYWKFYQ